MRIICAACCSLSTNNLPAGTHELLYAIAKFCVCLQLLDLRSTGVSVLPCSLASLPAADILVDSNAMVFPPPEVCARGWSAVKSFLSECLHGTTPCYRLKIMLIGNTGEGKTSLVRAMRHFSSNPSSTGCEDLPGAGAVDRTFGVEMSDVVFPSRHASDGLHCSVWDFAGQELYHGTHTVCFSSITVLPCGRHQQGLAQSSSKQVCTCIAPLMFLWLPS
jgi:hypothetical protein